MAKPTEPGGRGRDPVNWYIVAALALAMLGIVIGASLLLGERGIEQQISGLDAPDLLALELRQGLPPGRTPVETAGPLAIEAEVYVPVYSTIYAGQGFLHSNLAATLSIRNTSLTEPIVVREVRYFDTDGKLVQQYVDAPHNLAPMATADFYIDATDVRGGTGANFVVIWAADAAASEPVIEAVMLGSIGTKGISFISRGTRVEPASGTD